MTSEFLKTLQHACHLSEKTLAMLEEDEMTHPIHFQGCTVESLISKGLKLGPAHAIVHYFNELTNPKTDRVPQNISVEPLILPNSGKDVVHKFTIVTETDDDKIKNAIASFNGGNLTAADTLIKLGVNRVVKDEKGGIFYNETKNMLGFKGNLGSVWMGEDNKRYQIIEVSKLNETYIYLHFRSEKHLQNGIDPATGIKWILLGDVKLNLLWFAHHNNLLGFKDDEKIFTDFSSETGCYENAKLEYNAKYSDNPLRFIEFVKISSGKIQEKKDSNGKLEKEKEEEEEEKEDTKSNLNKHRQLSTFILEKFSIDDLKNNCQGNDNLRILMTSFNWNNSPTRIASDTVDCIVRHGITVDFFKMMLRERPRFRGNVLRLADLFKVKLS